MGESLAVLTERAEINEPRGRWVGYLNPALDGMPSWPIAYMNGTVAYGWIRGVNTPQPLAIWLPGNRRR